MRYSNFLKIGAIAFVVALAPVTSASSSDHDEIANAVMALAKSQWAAEMSGKSAREQMQTVADDYTEFNPAFLTRVDGKAMITRVAAVESTEKTVFADMQNPKVQVYGDTAILTYNYAGMMKGPDGTVKPNIAKSTRVYVNMGDAWKLVHAHFSTIPSGN
ncbi:YybH family protein [Hyphococcus sp. DH-69]|uniref:YybH family protein n=1 Tax=Hyphococcus formosus TaxID=3143534 RepID=UPI00398B9594